MVPDFLPGVSGEPSTFPQTSYLPAASVMTPPGPTRQIETYPLLVVPASQLAAFQSPDTGLTPAAGKAIWTVSGGLVGSIVVPARSVVHWIGISSREPDQIGS